MSLRPIITVPNEILRKISEPVQKLELMRKNSLKIYSRLCIMQGYRSCLNSNWNTKTNSCLGCFKENEKKPYCLINPRIKKFSKDTSKYEEGCLSIPDTFIEIERPKEIYLEYIDEKGKKKKLNVMVYCQLAYSMRYNIVKEN